MHVLQYLTQLPEEKEGESKYAVVTVQPESLGDAETPKPRGGALEPQQHLEEEFLK